MQFTLIHQDMCQYHTEQCTITPDTYQETVKCSLYSTDYCLRDSM